MNRTWLIAVLFVLALFGAAGSDAHAKHIASRGGPEGSAQALQSEAAMAGAPMGAVTARTEAGNDPEAMLDGARWFDPIARIASALGIMTLFEQLGAGRTLAAILASLVIMAVFVAALMFLWRIWRARPVNSRLQPAYAQRGLSPETVSALGREGMVYPQPSAPLKFEATVQPGAGLRPVGTGAHFGVPDGFDSVPFVRNAKIYFVRLQAAWDTADLADVREFTSPPMFVEISRQLAGREAPVGTTEVVTLDAELLGITSTGDEHMAGVRFRGKLRTQSDAPTVSFDEVWNLIRPAHGDGGWVLTSIQQIQIETPYQFEV